MTFGASTNFFTFDHAAVSTLSVAGVNGAFRAGQATGSPGAVSGNASVQTGGSVRPPAGAAGQRERRELLTGLRDSGDAADLRRAGVRRAGRDRPQAADRG